MPEERLPHSIKTLTLHFGKKGYGWRLLSLAIPILGATILFGGWEVLKNLQLSGGVVATFFFVCIVLAVTRQWTVEVAPATQRLTIYKLYVLRWTTIVLRTSVIEHCSFDECSMLGASYCSTDEQPSYCVYLDFKRGGRHEIPVQNVKLSEAMRGASELSAATAIPRQDEVD